MVRQADAYGDKRFDPGEEVAALRTTWFARAGIALVWISCALLYLTMPGSLDQ